MLRLAIQYIVSAVLNWILAKVGSAAAKRRQESRVKARAKALKEQLEAAETAEEREQATKDLANDDW